MASTDRNIPARPSPRSPPPPRPFESTPPKSRSTPKKKIKTKEQLKRSQVRTMIALVLLLILYIITIFISTFPFDHKYSENLDSGEERHTYWVNVPDILSQPIPVTIKVVASDYVEVFVITEGEYNEDLSLIELRNTSMNENHNKKTQFIYEDFLEPGKYAVVTYVSNNNKLITIDFEISRFFLLPFLGYISLIFMLPLVLCLVWIYVLQRRKASAPRDSYEYHDRTGHDEYYHTANDYYSDPHQDYYDQPHGYGYDHYHDPSQRQPRARREDHHAHDYKDGEYYDYSHPARHDYDDARFSHPTNNKQRAPRGGGMPKSGLGAGKHRKDTVEAKEKHEEKESSITTIPCKCGEVIVITDQSRPLRIKCSRCGRRGILEKKERNPEDEIFY